MGIDDVDAIEPVLSLLFCPPVSGWWQQALASKLARMHYLETLSSHA
jgi:hypothetical protein